jgi:hypothetical protein
LVGVDPDGKFIILLDKPIRIQPVDDRRRSAAMGFNYTAKSFIFRAAARSDTAVQKDKSRLNDTTQAVAGIEKTVEVGSRTFILLGQYAWGRESERAGTAVSVQSLFADAYLLGVRGVWSDMTSLQVAAVYSASTKSSFEQLDLERRLSDNWVLRTGADFFQGPSNTLIGLWRDQSRLRVGGDFIF